MAFSILLIGFEALEISCKPCIFIAMIKKLIASILGLFCLGGTVFAQCATTNVTGNLSPLNGDTLSGTYNITGNFTIGPGVTVYVRPWGMNGCGKLEIYAGGNINIQGTINADGAGFLGGTGGAAGFSNNAVFIEQCSSPTDQCGDIFTFGGSAGLVGAGPGGGLAGVVGVNGGGRKNRCLNFGDEGGRAGGAGGAGGGGGGSYGGLGTGGGSGGNASIPTMSTADVTCTSNPIVAGNGGLGGAATATNGTTIGPDIDLGTGGGGAGGGGRGRFLGTAGAIGGAGGGMVKLVSNGTMSVSGSISANGMNGGAGGVGGGAGASIRCCTDACPGVDEYTHTGSGGSGAGGGGGSGGGILLDANGVANITGTFSVRGGNGGAGGIAINGYTMNQNCLLGNSSASAPAGGAGQQGGAGGGGRIKVFSNQCVAGNNISPITQLNGGNGNLGPAASGVLGTSNLNSALVPSAAVPASQSICFNGDPSVLTSLAATGGIGSYSYQWQMQPNCTGAWQNIPGATTLSYDPPSGLQVTTCYRLEITSGTCVDFSSTLTVIVSASQVASVTPAGPIAGCVGDTTVLTTSGGSGATYQWYFNGSPIVAATDSFYATTATGSYMVEIIYGGGCNAFSAPIVASYLPAPSAFAVALQDTILCPGETVLMTGLGGGTYQWLLNGVPISGATSANFGAVQAGVYAVEVTVPGGCVSTSAPITITAGAVPSASLAASGATQFCEGDSVLLNAGGGQSYQWLLNGQLIPNANSSNYFALQTGDYEVIAIGPDGCADTSALVAVIADPAPIALLSSVGNPITCVGDTVLFFASGGTSFEWLFNGQPIGNTNAYLAAGTQGDYSVVVGNGSGCTDTSAVFAFSFFPPISVSISANGANYVCQGDSLPLNANGPGATGWMWYRNDTLISGANSSTYIASSAGAYTAVAIDQYGCEYHSAFQMVYPGESPHASLAVFGQSSLCGLDSIPLIASGGDNYEWFMNGATIYSGVDSIIWVNQAGDYQVAASSGCGVDTSAILTVNIANGPQAGFEYENHPQSEVQFRDMSISGASWFWNFGDGSGNSSLQNPLHQFPNPGTYSVTMITFDAQGCSDTITLSVIVTDPDFFIPNVFSPNGDGINDFAQTNFSKLKVFEFSIYDRWGKLVFVTDTQDTWWDGFVNGNAAPDGVYFYYLKGEFFNDRSVKEKGNLSLLR